MRISFSLQDLRSVSEDLGENYDIEANKGRSKAIRLSQREGASSFSKEKPSPPTPTKQKKWIRGVLAAVAIISFIAVAFIGGKFLLSYMSHEALRYHVILDCGSTGTRIYIYQWSFDHNKEKSNVPIALRSLTGGPQQKSKQKSGRAYNRMETDPGIHKLVHNESGLNSALLPLLQWAEKQIPKHAYKSTPVFLYATAGVRKLPSSDSDWLLDKAWAILKNSSFLCKKDWVKIITGMEEAYYGWIALNHDKDMLGSSAAGKTYGSLDLGGSSLQVTFETNKALQDETSISLKIASSSHHLSAYSLSGYGLNDAFDKSVTYLMKNISGAAIVTENKVEIQHPCLNKGYKEEYSCSRCAALNSEGSPLTEGEMMNKGLLPGKVIELVGAPQWQECSALAKVTVNLSEWSNLISGIDCNVKPCALTDGLPQPFGQFYAMSGFFVVFRFFNLTAEASLKDVLQAGKDFCRKTWEVAKNSVDLQPFIEQYCFRAPYIVSLLKDGLHLKDNQIIVGSGSITWTLGVALLEAGQAVSSRIDLNDYKIMDTPMNTAILTVMIFVSLVILCCALSCFSNWIPRFSRRLYLPLFKHNRPTNCVFNIQAPFRFQGWSPINTGDGRSKPPLSPVDDSAPHPFGMGNGFVGSSIQLAESSSYPLGVPHSYSASSLGKMQLGNGVGSKWTSHRGPTTLSSRRSQSREDLGASLAEIHLS